MANGKVAIIMGSQSDQAVMAHCETYLKWFDIDCEVKILSAHRNPHETADFAARAEENGFELLIAGAGMAAHLPGVVAAHTRLPVIGVPLSGSELHGLDALYSIVQMPSGVPVASMAIGKAGAINAAVFTAEILAIRYSALKEKLTQFKQMGCRLPK